MTGQPAQAPSDLLGAGADQRRVFGEEGPVDLHEAAGGEVME